MKENYTAPDQLSRPLGESIANYFLEMLLAFLPSEPVSNIIKRRLLISRGARIGRNPKFGRNLWIDGCEGLTIGDNVFFNYGCMLQAGGGITIGEDVLFGPGVTVLSANHETSVGICMRRSRAILRPVHIGSGAWIAARAVIAPGVTIGEGAIVACGAVVTRDVATDSLVGGSPARFIRSR